MFLEPQQPRIVAIFIILPQTVNTWAATHSGGVMDLAEELSVAVAFRAEKNYVTFLNHKIFTNNYLKQVLNNECNSATCYIYVSWLGAVYILCHYY